MSLLFFQWSLLYDTNLSLTWKKKKDNIVEFRFFFRAPKEKEKWFDKSKSVKSLAAWLKKIKIAGSSELRVSFEKSEIHCTEKQLSPQYWRKTGRANSVSTLFKLHGVPEHVFAYGTLVFLSQRKNKCDLCLLFRLLLAQRAWAGTTAGWSWASGTGFSSRC